MAGRRAARTAGMPDNPVIPSNALVASAVRFNGKVDRIFRGSTGWQDEAWRHYDICPELRFAAGWIGNALSRCVLRPAEVDDKGNLVETKQDVIGQALQEFFGGIDGQAQMLNAIGIHLTVVGEVYLVGRSLPKMSGLVWEVIGTKELTVGSGNVWMIDYGSTLGQVTLADSDVVIRVWRPHPSNRIEADSSVRALIPVLQEIEYLTRHMFAQVQSRLAGAGVQVWPDTVELPPVPGYEGVEGNKAEQLTRMLAHVAEVVLAQPDNPASLVPIQITVPESAVDKIKPPIHYWSPLDDKAMEMRQAATKRLGIGMDLPPEVIFGMSNSGSSSGGRGTGVSHWTSWQIEESAIKLHIEPLGGIFTNAVVVNYLRPVTEKANAAIIVDTDALKLQPDRSKEALELSVVGKISDASLRKFSGFSEADAPTPDEHQKFLLERIANAAASPEQVGWAMQKLGIAGFPDEPTTGGQQTAQPGPQQYLRPVAGPSDRADRSGPPEAAQIDRALVAGSEALVLRALERVGNRLRSQGVQPEGVAPSEVHQHAIVNGSAAKLLEGAWTTVPVVMDGVADPNRVTAALTSYTTELLRTQRPHDREMLCRYLAEV